MGLDRLDTFFNQVEINREKDIHKRVIILN